MAATWLPKLIIGDITCRWSVWFMANHFYAKGIESDWSDFRRRHNELVDRVRRERVSAGETVTLESQNTFRIRRGSVELKGTPDLVASRPDRITVIDAKSGQRRDSDAVQVKLYMACLPRYFEKYRGTPVYGQVAYLNGPDVEIEPEEATGEFLADLGTWLDLIESDDAPAKVPSVANCRFCKVTKDDCPERVETEPELVDVSDF